MKSHYSKFVKISLFIIPIIAIILLAIIVLDSDDLFHKELIKKYETKFGAEKSLYKNVNEKNQVQIIYFDKISKILDDNGNNTLNKENILADLQNPAAEIEMEDNFWINISSSEGILDINKEKNKEELNLEKNVIIKSTDGLLIKTNLALVDLNTYIIDMPAMVTGNHNQMALRSDSAKYHGGDNPLLILEKNASANFFKSSSNNLEEDLFITTKKTINIEQKKQKITVVSPVIYYKTSTIIADLLTVLYDNNTVNDIVLDKNIKIIDGEINILSEKGIFKKEEAAFVLTDNLRIIKGQSTLTPCYAKYFINTKIIKTYSCDSKITKGTINDEDLKKL